MAIPDVIGARANGVPVHRLDLTPAVPVVGRMLSSIDILPSLKIVKDCLDCRPLQSVSVVSLSSVPYVASPDNSVVKAFENGLSCRLRYLEVAVTSTASVVYNAVFGAVFSVLSLVTLGQVQMIVDQMRKHWIHTGLGVGAIGVSVVGTISPEFGVKLNAAALLGVSVAILRMVEGDVASKLSRAYQRHHQELRNAILEGLQGDRAFFGRAFVPLFNYLDTHLNDQVLTVPVLVRVLEGARSHLPTDIMPTMDPTATVNHLQRLFQNVGAGSAEGAVAVAG